MSKMFSSLGINVLKEPHILIVEWFKQLKVWRSYKSGLLVLLEQSQIIGQ